MRGAASGTIATPSTSGQAEALGEQRARRRERPQRRGGRAGELGELHDRDDQRVELEPLARVEILQRRGAVVSDLLGALDAALDLDLRVRAERVRDREALLHAV